MNWKTKYIQEKVSEKEEVIEVFGDGLFDLIDELNIDVDVEVNTSRLPYIKQDITSFTLNEKHVIELNVQKSTHMFETRIEVNLIKLAHDSDSDSIQQVTNVCSIVNNSGHYHIELDHDETYLYNQRTVELIYKKIVEEYLFSDEEVDEDDELCCVTVKTDHGEITDCFKQSEVMTIGDTGIKVGGKSAYPVK